MNVIYWWFIPTDQQGKLLKRRDQAFLLVYEAGSRARIPINADKLKAKEYWEFAIAQMIQETTIRTQYFTKTAAAAIYIRPVFKGSSFCLKF